jgi:hypothetical protein
MEGLSRTLDGKPAKKKSPWPAVWGATFSLAVWLPGVWWKGWVIQKLWGWFIAPLGYATPTIYVLIGMLAVFQAFLPRPPAYKGHSYVGATTNAMLNLLHPLALLIAGWVWHWAQWGVAH